MGKSNYNPNNMQKAASRNEFIAQGGNDGRFRNRVVEDKKKRENRTESRKFKQMARHYAY